ncbi:tetratricopeptide repeat protein [Prochlorococcus marinus]|uniref:tetratricopeptide repeat protein n=1 Tax=Prochlorococcus TaxID=1218 RepID=UPI0007B3D846|nr:tetratricopeptide repeat protein [Prochlorococcus marinus]KZR78682.1 TPR repeat-containing protein YrrB [Prochlorococcus marinus str. MIT 1323]
MADQATVKQLSATGRHQECLQACQNILQGNPEEAFAYKYAGKSLLTLGQLEKAHQCLAKAHQLDQTDPETAKDIGNSYLQLQDIDNARKWYQAALVINKGYAPAIFNLASLDNRSGNHKSAIALFKQAIAADPNLFQALLGAASSAMALGQVEQAIVFASNALEINPNTPKAHELLGIAYQNTGQQEKAIEHYQKEISRNATAITSLTNYGLILLQNNDVTASIKLLKQASEIGANEQITLLLAQTYQQQRQWTNAIAEYEKLNLEITKNKLIPFNYGLCLMEVGISDKAIEAFKTAIKLDQAFVGAWGNIGAIYKREGQLQEALEATKKISLLDPNNAIAHINLSSIYKDLGNLDLALTSTLKSLELNPDNPNVLSNLGLIYKDLGKLDLALEVTLKSLELKADKADVYINLGSIYKDLGSLDQALTSTLKSLELKADNPGALMNLGLIYKDLGNHDLAIEVTLKSLELKDDNSDVYINLAGIYQDQAKYDLAINSILKSLELNPDNANAYMNLGIVFEAQGKLDQAKEATLKSLELKPDLASAAWNLYGLANSIEEAEERINQCLEIDETYLEAKLTLGALKYHQGDPSLLKDILISKHKDHSHARSFRWALDLPEIPKLFFHRWALFDSMMDESKKDRPFYEFGVWRGISFKYLINTFKEGYGFDTFEGLPEDWHNTKGGAYSAEGIIPQVDGGIFIEGKFENTLPIFFSKPRPIASIINFDADLYSSTLCALNHSKAIIDEHTILIFDEFIINENWEQDEYKALNEFCSQNKLSYQVIAISYFSKQVAVKLIGI